MHSGHSFVARIVSILMLAFSLVAFVLLPAELHAQKNSYPSAAQPPMGWNSWDSYGTTVNESQVKANADWMAGHLKAYGWQYITVDMEWFVKDPKPEGNAKDSHYEMDSSGRYQPSVERFPSSMNGAGFKPLADYIHSLGLKFGIHILQGIPREAVKQDLPISGSAFHALDAANSIGNLQMELRQLRPEEQCRRPGILRFTGLHVRGLGRGSHQDRLHLSLAIQGR